MINAKVVYQAQFNTPSPQTAFSFRGPVVFVGPNGQNPTAGEPINPSPPPAVTAAVMQIIEAPFGRMLP